MIHSVRKKRRAKLPEIGLGRHKLWQWLKIRQMLRAGVGKRVFYNVGRNFPTKKATRLRMALVNFVFDSRIRKFVFGNNALATYGRRALSSDSSIALW
jgi:hypothetical protein